MNPYKCTFLMGIESTLEYRFAFFVSMLSAIFPIIIQTTMWNHLYGQSDMAAVFGYSHDQILVYTLLATIVSQLVSGEAWTVNADIKLGGLNKYLVRPVSYMRYVLCNVLGNKVPKAMVLGPVAAGMLLFSVVVLNLSLTVWRVFAFVTSLFLGILLNFFIFYCVALIGFWLTDVDKLFGTVSIVVIVISGGVFPMDIFGKAAEIMVNLLPFGYTIQFPVNIINGRFGTERVLLGFMGQIIWLLLFMLIGKIMWHRGLKRYVAVGG